MTDTKLQERLIAYSELLEKCFPKGACSERGEAMVLISLILLYDKGIPLTELMK